MTFGSSAPESPLTELGGPEHARAIGQRLLYLVDKGAIQAENLSARTSGELRAQTTMALALAQAGLQLTVAHDNGLNEYNYGSRGHGPKVMYTPGNSGILEKLGNPSTLATILDGDGEIIPAGSAAVSVVEYALRPCGVKAP